MICKNCGKEIDDKAVICVHCKETVKKKKLNPILLIPIAFILFLITITSCVNCIDDTETPTSNAIITTVETTKDTTQETTDQTTISSETTETTTDTTVETTVKTTKTPVTETKPDTNKKPAATEAEKPKHTHSFSAATCTTPKTCSCGATEGKANGHSWKSATCTSPKTCTVCGATSGKTAGHNFYNGNCTSCGKEDPDYVRVTMVWIPTNGGTKYHTRSGCSNMENPEQVSESYAESLGFTPCKRCH